VGPHRSAAPFSIWTRFEEPKPHLAAGQRCTETEKGYKVVAELPGMDEKNIEVKIANGMLTIKGEKQEEKEEEKQDYYVRELSNARSRYPRE
jgi:ribosomal 30S subunit maturation factor RimM